MVQSLTILVVAVRTRVDERVSGSDRMRRRLVVQRQVVLHQLEMKVEQSIEEPRPDPELQTARTPSDQAAPLARILGG